MTVILMTQETGSLGDEVAAVIADCMNVELVRRERLERCIAERMQINEATVQRIFKGNASLLERCMIDSRRLSRCMGEEVVRLAASDDVLIQPYRTIPLLRLIKHVVCVHVCATAAQSQATWFSKIPTMMGRAMTRDKICPRGATHERIRRLFGHERESLESYDLVINTERIPVAQCAEQVQWLAQSPQFQPTPASRTLLANLLQETQQPCILGSAPTSEPTAIAHVVINSSRVKLGDVVNNEQAIARIEDHLHGRNQSSASHVRSFPPPGMLG